MAAGETRARLRREDDEEEAAFAAGHLLVHLASDTWWHPVVPSGDAPAAEIDRDTHTADGAAEDGGST